MEASPRGRRPALFSRLMFGALLALTAAVVHATPFSVDFETAPFAGTTTSFTADGFTFTFQADGDGGDFAYSANGGEGGSGGIDALSDVQNTATTEIIEIMLTGGGSFFWDSLWLDNAGAAAEPVDVAGLLGAGTPFSTTVGAGAVTTVNAAGVEVDRIRLTSASFEAVIFDTLAGKLPMDNSVPAPTTLAVFGLGLAALGWSRRRPPRRPPPTAPA